MGVVEGRIAVVTGAGRGIGRTVALELARQGAKVVVNDAGVDPDGTGHDAGPAAAVCEEIARSGGAAVPNDANISSWDAAEELIDTAMSTFGRVDILVNNAGNVRYRRFEEMTEEQWDSVVAVHLKGTFNCCRHAAPHMIEQGHGRMVNMISAAVQGFPAQANYVAAKAGVLGLTMALAVELGDHGITANAFAPSGHTRLLASMRAPSADAAPDAEAAANAPLVTWLASDSAATVNGQVFGWGGGSYQLFEQVLTPAVTFYKPGPATVDDFVAHGGRAFGPSLQPVGRGGDPQVIRAFVERVDRND